jgi:hypothetical protein
VVQASVTGIWMGASSHFIDLKKQKTKDHTMENVRETKEIKYSLLPTITRFHIPERGRRVSPPKAGANLFIYWIRPMPRDLFTGPKTRTILPPERAENDERYPIKANRKRYGVRPPNGAAGQDIHSERDRITTQSRIQFGGRLIRIIDNHD